LVVVDITEQEDLKRICLGLTQSELRVVWVGSTGLAEFVPLALETSFRSNTFNQEYSVDSRPALALVGSASETTREQLRQAQVNNGLNTIHLDPARLIQNGTAAASELEQAISNLRSVIDAGHDAALVVRASREEIAATQQFGATLNLSTTQVAQRIVDGLAQLGRMLICEGLVSGVVATGGDTANALCKALAVQALEILGEVEAGIPVMRMLGEQSLPLVTKAGGFGSPSAFANAFVRVKQYV
jgi:uncharacterized protein YgbK (DUF1537 family)